MRPALPLAAWLSLLLAGFAGCLEDELSLLTAKDARGRADREAGDWAGDAELMGAIGFEAGPDAREALAQALAQDRARPPGSGEGGEEDGGDRADERAMFGALATTDDRDVGDGRAPVWAFTYASEAEEATLHVVVTSEGASSATEGGIDERAVFGPLGGRPVTGWEVDSDDGAHVARGDEGYLRAVGRPGALAFTMLFQGTDGPVWVFAAEAGDWEGGDEDGAMVALDATDGTLLDAQEVLGEAFGFLVREFGQSGGTIGVQAAGSFGAAFDVALAGHRALAVLVSVSPPPLSPMQVTVTDPAGTEHTATIGPTVGLEATGSLLLGDVPVGGYEVAVTVDAALANDWEVSWCTDGAPLVPQGSRACELVP